MILQSIPIIFSYFFLSFSLMIKGYNIDINKLNQEKPVILVNVISRHGTRAINNYTFPTDTFRDKRREIWPEGYLELTKVGKQEQYELGRYLRKRYDFLLGERYTSDSVYALSTDTNRSIMSALCLLAGLYPPKGNQIWNSNLLWQPIPVYSYEEKSGNVLKTYDRMTCPQYFKERDSYFKSEDYMKLIITYNDLMEHLTKNSGKNVSDFFEVAYMLDYFKVQVENNLTIPTWAQKFYPEPWTTAALQYYLILTANDKLKRLSVGPLLKDINDQFESKITMKSERKFSLYSGHGDNVANILNIFNGFNWLYPPTSSAVLIELRRDNSSNPFVTIFYKNSTNEAYPIEIPGCGEVCSWKQFQNYISPFIPIDWDKECTLSSALMISGGYTSMLMLIIVLFLRLCG